MSYVMKYKGHRAAVEFSVEDMALFGKILDIDDVVIFEIADPNDAFSVFKEVIDDYLDFCKENDKVPCKPYNGRFNVRIEPGLHRRAARRARRMGISLNTLVTEAMRREVDFPLRTQRNAKMRASRRN